ncbi:MAG: hypothetical protein WCO84_00630 [bacterium]
MVKNVDEALENFKQEIFKRRKKLNSGQKNALLYCEVWNEINAMASVLGLTKEEKDEALEECGISKGGLKK